MKSLDIRETFLSFYEGRDHRRYDSVPLIPNDPTLLLTIAGMVPFKPYFMGDSTPPHPRATSYQKCVRTNDIENVGRTTRHLTMFEMLGNFSFGDYFKKQAIAWAWELSVSEEEGFGLDPDRIWATVWEHDDESEDIWLQETDVPAGRIQRLGREDNYWWTHVAGPGGPNTELYYDRGPDFGQEGGPEVDDERYLEYFNVVFMQSELDDDGNILRDLPQQNVDTGLGLERMAVIKQDVANVYETDLFRPLLDRAIELTGATYGEDVERDVSLRVIAEHARVSAHLIADGVLPAKEGRGYVLRRLLRRAVRHSHLLGLSADLMEPMIESVIEIGREGWPELERQRELVTRVASAEEADFRRRLEQGLSMVEEEVVGAKAAGTTSFGADAAFKLHDTYGFPIELTTEIVEDAGLELDRAAFDALMQEQRERARAAAKKGGDGIAVETYREAAAAVGDVEFVGYGAFEIEATVGAMVTSGGLLEAASEGDEFELVLRRTPFYAEGGGQVGDRGVVETDTARLDVLDTQEAMEGLIVHRVRVAAGEVTAGQAARAVVDVDRRVATARSHSATHVLHATIKEVLGDHAQQAGSLVQPGRLRFDFPHFDRVGADQLATIEETINARVLRDPHVHTDVMSIEDAKAAGAVANFGDKYGEVVRVVTIGDFSKELCGGTHVPTGATIGSIHVVREESIGSNTRRIEALTGLDAYRYAAKERLVAEEVARLLDTKTDEAVERVAALLDRVKGVEKELAKVRAATLSQQAKGIADAAERADGLAVVAQRFDGLAMDDLRQLALEIRGHLRERGVVILGAKQDDGKAQLITAVTDDLVTAGTEARPILHPAAQAVGGGAGGKGELAQAGGRDGDRLDEALDIAVREARAAAAT